MAAGSSFTFTLLPSFIKPISANLPSTNGHHRHLLPVSEYRPGQRHMLEVAATVARDGGIAMVDAPTGSGKSSVVASLLAERKKRKIVIAVRTISQLTTFIRELELVKKKQPQIKTVYLVGKKSMCPLGGRRGRVPPVRRGQSLLELPHAGPGREGGIKPDQGPVHRPADPAHGQGAPAPLPVLHCEQDVRTGRDHGRPDGPLDRTAITGRAGDPKPGPAQGTRRRCAASAARTS